MFNYVIEDEIEGIITKLDKEICGGHHAWRATTYKLWREGYYWTILFSDTSHIVRECIECQLFAGKQKLNPLPLNPIKTSPPFSKGNIFYWRDQSLLQWPA